MGTNDGPTVADGGEPSYDHEMDRRLTVLETRFDTLLPTLATKSDLEALRSEVRAGLEKMHGNLHAGSEKIRGDFGAELKELRGEFRAEFEKLRGEFRAELEELRGEFRAELEKLRTDQLKMHNDFMKWIIGLCISLFVAVIGFDIAIFNAVNKAAPAKQTPAAIAAQKSIGDSR